MIWTPSPRPPMSEWPTNFMLRDAAAGISFSPFFFFIRGHSRSKNGVASLAYDPRIHPSSQEKRWIAGASPAMTKNGSCDLRRLKAAAQEQLPDARIGEDFFRAVGHARASELQHDAMIRM